jgi:predicted N-acyltransferase
MNRQASEISLGLENLEMGASEKGWVTAVPLEGYSSLHEVSLGGFLGWENMWPKKHFFIQIDFNVHTQLQIHPQAYFTFHLRDADKPPAHAHCCYMIKQLQRWEIDISAYSSFDDYLGTLIRWHRCNYDKTKKTFNAYGCQLSYIEGDWSQHAETAYRLYCNVAKRYGEKLYDLKFFQATAKRSDYKLLSAWFEGAMIGMYIFQEEFMTLHSSCCGFDYNHSSKCYLYSWLHFELIRLAIEAKKYQKVEIGITADESKSRIGFKPIPCCLDIYTKGLIPDMVLRTASVFTSATIDTQGKIKVSFR